MVLNARKVYRPGNKIQQVLLAIDNVTERVRLEREHAVAHQRIGMLLQEMTHRVKNSLQSIAAMVMIEARSHKSGEGKAALERVSHRIDALGQLYSKLSKSDAVETVDAATYLDDLCRDLLASVNKEGGTSIVLKTDIESELLPTDEAVLRYLRRQMLGDAKEGQALASDAGAGRQPQTRGRANSFSR